MRNLKISTIIASFMTLAACSSNQEIPTSEAYCANKGDGYTVYDSVTDKPLIRMGEVFQEKDRYVYGQSMEVLDVSDPLYNIQSEKPYVHSGFNVYLDKNEQIKSCQMGGGEGGQIYYPKPATP